MLDAAINGYNDLQRVIQRLGELRLCTKARWE